MPKHFRICLFELHILEGHYREGRKINGLADGTRLADWKTGKGISDGEK